MSHHQGAPDWGTIQQDTAHRRAVTAALEPLVRTAMGAGVAAFSEKAAGGEIDPGAPLTEAFGDFPSQFIAIRTELVDRIVACMPATVLAESEQVVTTLDELRQLPAHAVVLDNDETAMQSYGDGTWSGAGRDWEAQQVSLPATVLWMPAVPESTGGATVNGSTSRSLLIAHQMVEQYAGQQHRDAAKYSNRELLDASSIYDLHTLVARVYQMGFNEGLAVEGWTER